MVREDAGVDLAVDVPAAQHHPHLPSPHPVPLLRQRRTTLPFDDGIANKPDKDWISNPDIEDMFAYRYPAGAPALVPSTS